MRLPENYPVQPLELWQRFYEITQIPRPSKQEQQFVQYLVEQAKRYGLEYRLDQAQNVVIYLPATKGYESHPTIILQAHSDMVCDKLPERVIDFATEPLDIYVENGWIKARGTTLGADNGIGCAFALALLGNDKLAHPPLELLFTSDEETGLNGALNLDASMLQGKRLINTDTEEWGAVYIGCAGGIDYELKKHCALTFAPENLLPFQLIVGGLKGGHSGIDIHQGRQNAIKILAEVLWELDSIGIELAEFSGGRAHNIIPRDASALILIRPENEQPCREMCVKKLQQFLAYMNQEDQNLFIKFVSAEKRPEKIYTKNDKDCFLNLMNLFPHGAHGFNWLSKEPLVNYSNNLAIARLQDEELFVKTSLRYFERNESIPIELKLQSLAKSFGLELVKGGEYPSWRPEFENNQLLELAKQVFRDSFNHEIEIKAIHAGLECGILKDKLGRVDAISIGPNLKAVHSPSEALEIDSTVKCFEFLTKILERA